MKSRRDFLAAAVAASILGASRSSSGVTAGSFATDAAGPAGADEYMLSPGLVYLNTGSTGPTRRAVLERTVQAWTQLETNPVQQASGQEGVIGLTDQVRAKAAAFLGCSVEEILITRSTSEGMNTVAQGMRLGAGDRVLTTDQEHEGGSACWDYLAERRGIVKDTVAIAHDEHDPSAIVRRFEAAIKPATKVISVSHVLWTTGSRMPVAELSALARRRGILSVVDGAQAAGQIPVDVKQIGCHAYATTGHKWMLGPKGTGMLYVSADAADAIKPIQWTAGKRVTSGATGIGPLPLVVGLGEAIDYISGRGVRSIEAHNMALRARAHRGLKQLPGVRVMSPEAGPLTTALVSFALPAETDARALLNTLRDKHHIQLKAFPGKPFNGLRLSPHLFNTEADIDAALRALRAELKSER
jgi:selenocysteine lyase/cysteine desulfurase